MTFIVFIMLLKGGEQNVLSCAFTYIHATHGPLNYLACRFNVNKIY